MGVFNWQDEVSNAIFEKARRLGLSVENSTEIANYALQEAGPGAGHGRVHYRVHPGTKSLGRRVLHGWWVTEFSRKDSHSAPEPHSTFVGSAAINKLWRAIKSVAPRNPTLTKTTKADDIHRDYTFGVKDVAKGMIRKGMLPRRFNYKTFSGGDERAEHYFPKYLYPMRVLDYLGMIRFGITSWRLK